MKKYIALILCALVSVLLLSACVAEQSHKTLRSNNYIQAMWAYTDMGS